MTLHRGKIAREPAITNVRSLTRDDLVMLRPDIDRTVVSRIGVALKLRDHHHRLARLVAAGFKNSEIMDRTGVSHSRISTHRKDPAFIELVAKYREKVDAAFEREQDIFYQVATSNMLKAEVMIAEKLETAEEEGVPLPTRDLIAISRDAADRFGYGKRNMNLNINVDFAAQLEKTIARSKGKTIDGGVATSSVVPQSQMARDVPAVARPSGHPSLPLIQRRA